MSPTMWPSRTRKIVAVSAPVLLGIVALSFASAGVLYLGAPRGGRPSSIWEALLLGMSHWLVWPLFIPVVVWLARRFPLGPSRWLTGLVAHVPASITVALAAIAATETLCMLGGLPFRGAAVWDSRATAVAEWFQSGVLVYWVIVAGVQAYEYLRHLKQREIEAVQFREELAVGQLQALRMQMHPHFLFNTLHTISMYVRDRRNDDAVDMIANLGDLLRTSLERGDHQEIALSEEVQFVKRYLEIEQLRFEDRLKVEIDMPTCTETGLVPAMILQPIVENSLRHGISRSPVGGSVRIHVRRHDDDLRIRVHDSGPGFDNSDYRIDGLGVGLRNVRLRLEHLYGDRGKLETHNRSDGATVELCIPFHVEPVFGQA